MKFLFFHIYFYLIVLTAMKLGDWTGLLTVLVIYGLMLTWLQRK